MQGVVRTAAHAVSSLDLPPLVVDCDPGQDDAVALAVAAQYGNLVGVTTVSGNAPLDLVTDNALMTCQLFDIDVPVVAGAAQPLECEPMHAPEIHGASGFSGPDLPILDKAVAPGEAAEFLIETARSHEDLWIVQIGPATNVALALSREPELAQRLGGISFMGGSAGGGNRTAAAEFNALADPEALAVVLASGSNLVMCGLDLTSQFAVDDELESAIRSLATAANGQVVNRGALIIADLFAHYLDRVEAITGRRLGGLHDPCAVLAVTHPELFKTVERPVGVEVQGALTRGMTVVDTRHRGPAGPQPDGFYPVAHCAGIDAAAARRLVLDAIAGRGGP